MGLASSHYLHYSIPYLQLSPLEGVRAIEVPSQQCMAIQELLLANYLGIKGDQGSSGPSCPCVFTKKHCLKGILEPQKLPCPKHNY